MACITSSFKTGLTNVVVATDILEEGIDVPKCNIVIMFDGIKTFRSYVQSRGRARMKGSEFIILSHSSNSINSRIDFFKEIDLKLNNVCVFFFFMVDFGRNWRGYTKLIFYHIYFSL